MLFGNGTDLVRAVLLLIRLNLLGRIRQSDRTQMSFGMRTDVGEACGILDARNLPGIRVCPAPALLELHGVIVEQYVDWNGG